MASYNEYPQTIHSNVDWLGCIPAHWKVVCIKHITPVKRGASPRPIDDPKYFDDDGEFAWVRIADVSASDRYLKNTTQRLSDIGEQLSVKRFPGDLFLSIAGSVGKPIITKIKCCIHDGFVYFPDYKENISFLFYLFDSGQPYLGLGKMGTQLNLNTDTVGSIKVGLPPLDEQVNIVKFLDHKTAQIDALIAKKQALLEKLAEQRTALISQAVTKGLDPSVPMKDSGVEWLGEIPAHWNAIRVRHISEFVTSGSRGWAQYYSNDGNVFLRITNVSRHSVDLLRNDIQRVSPPRGAEGDRTKTSSGDIVVSITADLGSVAVIPEGYEEAYVSQHLALIRPQKGRVYPRWLAYQVFSQHGKAQLTGAGYGGTKIQLSLPDIKDLWISLPPLDVQKNICTAIDAKVEKLVFQCSKVHKIIEKLHEYRAALITNAVTGKIDVRDFCIPTTTEQREVAHG